MTGCHKRESITFIFISGKVAGARTVARGSFSPFSLLLYGKQQRTDWLRAFPPQHPMQSGSGAIARDSLTNRFNGVPLLGPNSMMEWLGWARAMNGAWNQR